MTASFNMHQAKSQLSRLIAMAEAGEDVLIARDGKPVARIIAVPATATGRRFGALAGQIVVGDAILDPLPEDELVHWE